MNAWMCEGMSRYQKCVDRKVATISHSGSGTLCFSTSQSNMIISSQTEGIKVCNLLSFPSITCVDKLD